MRDKWIVKNLARVLVMLPRVLVFALPALLVPVAGQAKMYEAPTSFSLKDKSQERVQLKVLPKLDTARLLAEDQGAGKNSPNPVPARFAVEASVSYTLSNSGTWQTVPGGRVWRLRIQSPGAKSLNLGITRYDMPEGAKLWVYDPGRKHVEGPYTSANRSHLGSLWTPIIEGEEIDVEVFVPTGVAQPTLEIGKAGQGYRALSGSLLKGGFGGTEGTCNNDVICPAGDPWRKQIRAVGVYTFNVGANGFVCTGTMLNDTAVDFTPYFLTANHCTVDGTNDATVVVYWNFELATCGTHGPGSTADNQTGSIFHAASAPSDFRLLELSAKPDPTYNIYYAGWDVTGTIPPSTVGIHHPSGDVKAISLSNTPPDTTAYNSPTHDPAGNHWRVLWDSGVTEPGSSGSCLFETVNNRCIGQLHGGPSMCGGADLHDYYGRLSVSWAGGGTAATRLQDWLDPVPTGATSLDGDPHITTTNAQHYDFQSAGEFVSLRDPNGLEIQTRQTPIATTFSPPVTDPHDGLAMCVSVNSAVAMHMGKHRVTYEPNLNGLADPSGMQLRVDGTLTAVGPNGLSLSGGGRILKTSAPGGLEFDFPDGSIMFATPGWWSSQGKWFLNVDITRPTAADGAAPGAFPVGGIAGAITPDTWLPKLPDGSSLGAMPGALHDRYVGLYGKFADAWRVNAKTSLFDYAPGTSTDTFTMRSWPSENQKCVIPGTKPAPSVSADVAARICQAVKNDNAHRNCLFDVMVTGAPTFAKTYQLSKLIALNSTRITVTGNAALAHANPAVLVANVEQLAAAQGRPPGGSVQFMVDGRDVGAPVRLDANGQATWTNAALKSGNHVVTARYLPAQDSTLLPSTSMEKQLTVTGKN